MGSLSDKGAYTYVDHFDDESLVNDLLAVCTFSAIGLLLSFRVLLVLAEMPDIMAAL